MSDTELQEDDGPISPVEFEVPDKPYEELNALEKRWFKIKEIPSFPFKVPYFGECGLPLEYCDFLPEGIKIQAMEVIENLAETIFLFVVQILKYTENKNELGFTYYGPQVRPLAVAEFH